MQENKEKYSRSKFQNFRLVRTSRLFARRWDSNAVEPLGSIRPQLAALGTSLTLIVSENPKFSLSTSLSKVIKKNLIELIVQIFNIPKRLIIKQFRCCSNHQVGTSSRKRRRHRSRGCQGISPRKILNFSKHSRRSPVNL